MSSTTFPSEIHIGTRNFSLQGREYKYIFDERVDCYICGHQTTTSVPGEVLAIMLAGDSDASPWYAAAEGCLEVQPDGRASFRVRQPVFRTQERFWETGEHKWQLNSQSSPTNTSEIWDGSMTAQTEVPQNAIGLAVEAQLALTNA